MKVLLLAGSAEGRALATLLAGVEEIDAVASLAGVTRDPAHLPLPTRRGGFGGEAAQSAYIQAEKFDAIIDATHPFATLISARTARIAKHLAIPCLHVIRAQWQPQNGDKWTCVESGIEAPEHIKPGAKVFLATGTNTLPDFAGLSECTLTCRRIDPPKNPFPFTNGSYLLGKPPFSVAEEMDLFTRLKIDWLVTKNAGGQASRSKLDAARQMGLPVLMINRPALPDGPIVSDVDAVISWLNAL